MTDMETPNYHFEHIYNGIIFKDSIYYPMIEFKIIKNNDEIKEQINFSHSNFKCGWFIVDAPLLKLIGPINIDNEKIKSGIRMINDELFPEINGLIIESISNDVDSLIPSEQIPFWMIKHLNDAVL